MNYCRYLLYGLLALLVSGCGQTVKESLKVQPIQKSMAGADKTVVVLPFADYSYADNLETAYRRNLFITENLTDQLVSNSFSLPVQEDVFFYLVNQKIINVVAYEKKKTSVLQDEMQDEWSGAMKAEMARYIDLAKSRDNNKPVLQTPGTHGLTREEVAKIGRHFGADYILRGRIVQYKERQDPSWAPWKKGVLSFVTGVTNKVAFGQANAEKYDELGNMLAGGMYGMIAGNRVNGQETRWPWSPNKPDQTILGVSTSSDANIIFWGAVGGGLGKMASNTGKIPQAVVQLRIWVQDANSGDVVWTNRVDVKVSPKSVLADYQYDALFESATQKAVTTLIDDFVNTGI